MTEESEEDDLPEEGLLEEDLRQDTSADMEREIELMLYQAMTNGLSMIYNDALHELINNFGDVFRP